MTAENRQFAMLQDILAVVIRCGNCGVKLSLPPAKWGGGLKYKCVVCDSEWHDGNETVHKNTEALLNTLQYLSRSGTDKPRFQVLLEMLPPNDG